MGIVGTWLIALAAVLGVLALFTLLAVILVSVAGYNIRFSIGCERRANKGKDDGKTPAAQKTGRA